MLNMKTLSSRRERAESSTAVELLVQTPIDRLEETVKALKRHRPAKEVRDAMMQRVAAAPLSEFETLKQIFLIHFPDWH